MPIPDAATLTFIKAYAIQAAHEEAKTLQIQLDGFKRIMEVELEHIKHHLATLAQRIYELSPKDPEDEEDYGDNEGQA